MEIVNRLVTEGNYPCIILAILAHLDLCQFALAELLYEQLFTPEKPLHSWLQFAAEKKGLFRLFYQYDKHPVTGVPALARQQFYFSKILTEYTSARFFNLCQELIWTFTKEFQFNSTDNGKMISNRWGLVDRLFYPLGNAVGGYSPVGSVEYSTFLFNPRFDFLAVTAKDYLSHTMAIFAFGKNKGTLNKIQYHFTKCGRTAEWLDIGWSGNGRYLLAVEYLPNDVCVPHVFFATDQGTIVALDTGGSIPHGNSKHQTAKTWCERYKGFVWSGVDSELYFISIDGPTLSFSITKLSGSEEFKNAIKKASKIITLSERTGRCATRIAWIRKCLEDHGECDCNDGHDLIQYVTFDLNGIRESGKDSSTIITNGNVLDLTYDMWAMRLVFAVVALPGCKLGAKSHDIFYVNGKNGVLNCWERESLQYNCPNKRIPGPFSPREVNPQERKMLIGDIQVFGPPPPEYYSFNSNIVVLGQYQYNTMCSLYNNKPWLKWILTSTTDDLILLSGKNMGCEIVVFRKHKAWSVKAYNAAEGPHFRHRTKPYYIKKKWWISRTPIIEIYYVSGSSTYLLSHYYPATHLETEYTESRLLTLKEPQKIRN